MNTTLQVTSRKKEKKKKQLGCSDNPATAIWNKSILLVFEGLDNKELPIAVVLI